MIVCAKCNSSNIEQAEWVNVNTGKTNGVVNEGGQEDEDRWCNDCQTHTSFKEIEE
jgi:hypothetical protein